MGNRKIAIIFLFIAITLIFSGCLTKREVDISKDSTQVAEDLSKYITTESHGNDFIFKTNREVNGIEFEFEKNINEKNFKFSGNTLHLFYEKNGKKRLMIARKGGKGFENEEFLYAIQGEKPAFKVVDVDKNDITKVAEGKIQTGISIIDNIMNKDGYDEVIIHGKNVNNVKTLYFEIGFNKDIFEIDTNRGNKGIEFLNSLKDVINISITPDNDNGTLLINVMMDEEINIEDEDIIKIYVKGNGDVGISNIYFIKDKNNKEKSKILNASGENNNVKFYDGQITLKEPKLLGDFNNDGIVDLDDVVLFSQYNGLQEGGENYKESYDIAPSYNDFQKDGWEDILDTSYEEEIQKIDLKDFTTLSANFGKSVPNNVPLKPVAVDPETGDTGVSIQPTLKWYSNDKDGEKLSYALYFGETTSVTVIATTGFLNKADFEYSYDLSQIYEKLDNTKTYYWQVLVTDSRGATTLSDLFSFTTEGISNLKPVVTQIDVQEITEGSTFSIYLPDYITDPEDDAITFSLGEDNEAGEITEGSTFIYYPDYDAVSTADGSKTFRIEIEAWDDDHINNPSQMAFEIKVLNKNRVPEIELTTPPNGEKSVDTTNVKFTWDATDLDGDTMTYYFYFGTNQNSLEEKANTTSKEYTYGVTLEEGTTYYWKVKASDGTDEVFSDIYSFTTKGFRNGGQKEKIDVGYPIRKGLAISENGYMFFTSDYGENEGKLYVYSAVEPGGTPIDETIIDAPITTIPTLDNDNTVYFATLEGKVYAYEFDGQNLEEKWEVLVGVPIYTSPAIDGQGRLYIGDNNGILHVINIENGEELETYETNGKIKSSVAIDNSGNIFFGSYDGNLYGLKWNDDNLEDLTGFPVEFTNEKIITSPAIDNDNNKLYIATLSGKIYEINIANGNEMLLKDTKEYIRISPVIGDTVYFATTSGKLYKGEELIKDFGAEISGVPAIGEDASGDELIYVPVLGNVYALESSGDERWTFSTSSDEPIRGNIEIAKDGSIYAGSTNGSLYIIYDSQNMGIYPGKWPVFQKNSMHTAGNRAPLKPYSLNPVNGKLSVNPEEDFVLKWNGKDYDEDTLTYYIYTGNSEKNLTALGTTTENSTTLSKNSLKYGKTYYWKVVAEDTHGASTTSDIQTFGTQIPLIAGGTTNIYSIDVSDKTDPQEIDSAAISFNAITVDGTYAYIASDDGFYVYDVSPTNLNKIDNDEISAKNLVDLDKEGDYIYALSSDTSSNASRLVIYDVSDPSNITVSATVATDLSANVKAIDVYGDYAYIIDQTNKFVIYDVSTPSAPTVVASFTTNISTPTDIAVNDEYAFISCEEDGIIAIDISNPENPSFIKSLKYENNNTKAVALYLYGNKLYVANNNSNKKGVAVINTVYPDRMYEERFISIGSGTPSDIYVDGTYIYVAAGNDGLRILDESGEIEKGSYGIGITSIGGIYSEE